MKQETNLTHIQCVVLRTILFASLFTCLFISACFYSNTGNKNDQLKGIYISGDQDIQTDMHKNLEDYISTYTSYWSIFLGTILIIFVIFMPDGIVGRINRILYRMKFQKQIGAQSG